MNKMKMVELLKGKVDSLERWQAVCEEAGAYWHEVQYGSWPDPGFAFHYGAQRYIGSPAHAGMDKMWWLIRESYRQILGVYPERTDVLNTVVENSPWLRPYCIHISKDDPTMVAYTPTPEDGARDKQVRMSFGRLLRKLCMLFTDEHIKQLEASHRSELDPTFLVARTPEEVQRVYTTMAGDGGCMRYPPGEWGLPDNLHPSHVYSYAGLGVAYTEFEGVIKSRAVIYDNPDKPEDKRYVRIYGDGSLKRKLELAGYRCDNLQGAKIRAIDVRKYEAVRALAQGDSGRMRMLEAAPYLVPYLDGAGGSQEQRAGSFGYIIEGEDCIRLINEEQAERLGRVVGGNVPRFKSTSARHAVPVVRAEQLQFTCAISGEVCNSLETASIYVLHEGQVKLVQLKHKPTYSEAIYHYLGTMDPGQPWDEGLRARGTQQVVVHAPAGSRRSVAFSESNYLGHWVLDTPQNRAICGFVPVAQAGGGTKWAFHSAAVQFDGTWYAKADCTTVFDAEGNEVLMPQSKVDALRQADPKKYVALAPKGSTKALSHVDNPRLVMTLGKRRCVKDWHPILQLWDGTWDYSTNVRHSMIFSFNVYSSTKQPAGEIRMTEEAMRAAFAEYIDAARAHRLPERRVNSLQSFMSQKLRAGYHDQHFFLKGNALFRGSYWQDGSSLDAMRAAMAKLKAMSDQEVVDTWDQTMLPIARGWQHHAELLFKIGDEAMAPWLPQPAPSHPMADADNVLLNELLTETAVHIRDERFASAA